MFFVDIIYIGITYLFLQHNITKSGVGINKLDGINTLHFLIIITVSEKQLREQI